MFQVLKQPFRHHNGQFNTPRASRTHERPDMITPCYRAHSKYPRPSSPNWRTRQPPIPTLTIPSHGPAPLACHALRVIRGHATLPRASRDHCFFPLLLPFLLPLLVTASGCRFAPLPGFCYSSAASEILPVEANTGWIRFLAAQSCAARDRFSLRSRVHPSQSRG